MGGDKFIEELPISFTAVAANIDEEKEVWLNEGSLIKAIRASISIPLFFTPYKYKGMLLVDGGVLNPVPIAPTFHDDTDITIAVNLGGDISQETFFPKEKEEQADSFRNKITSYLSNVALPDSIVNEDGMYVIANKSFEAMQSTIARMKLATYPPDIEINIPRNLCGTFEFNRSEEIIEYGYNMCKKTFAQHKGV